MGCTGPDADADEKAADEDKMLKQVFATKNGMQAEQQQQELEQGSFLFLRAPALTPSNNFSTFSAPSARFRNTICKICKGQAGKGGKKLKPLPHLESTSSPVEFSHIKSKYNPNICHIAQHIAMQIYCDVTFAKFIQNCDWWPSDIVVTSPFSKAIMKLAIKKNDK